MILPTNLWSALTECRPQILSLQIRPSDGYINASRLAKSGGKKCYDYFANGTTQLFLDKLSIKLSISKNALVESRHGGINRGTWIHPQVATHFAAWISSEFAACVSGWIERAKAQDPDIQAEYNQELSTLKEDPANIDQKEHAIRDALAARLGGTIEVEAAHGLIDVLTSTEVIEVKYVKKYLHAIGQVLGYSESFPEKTRCIHLFGSEEELSPELLARVTSLCDKHNIIVTHEIA